LVCTSPFKNFSLSLNLKIQILKTEGSLLLKSFDKPSRYWWTGRDLNPPQLAYLISQGLFVYSFLSLGLLLLLASYKLLEARLKDQLEID